MPLLEPETPPVQSPAPPNPTRGEVPRWMAQLRRQMGPPPPRLLLGPIVPARLGGIRMPQVDQPPTGQKPGTAEPRTLSADEHHDRIRLAVRRFEGLLRSEQAQTVREVEDNADWTRRRLAALALQVPGAIAWAQQQIQEAVAETATRIRTRVADLGYQVQSAPVDTVELEATRDAARQQVLQFLGSHESDETRFVRETLDTHLGIVGPTLNGKLAGILEGERPASFEIVPAPDDPVPEHPPRNLLQQGSEPGLRVAEGVIRAQDTWKGTDDPAREWLTVYADLWRCTFFCERVVPGLHTSAADQIHTAAENARTSGVEDTYISLLGLVAPSLPVAPDMTEQAAQPDPAEAPLPSDETERAREQHRRQVEAARSATAEGLLDKADRAIAFLEQEVRDKQIEMLRITGERLQRTFFQKAAQLHVELMNEAGPLADRYRQMANTTGGLLKSDVELDSTVVVPQVEELQEQAEQTRPTELKSRRKYGDLQVAESQRIWNDQRDSFARMIRETRENLADWDAVIDLDLSRMAAPFVQAHGDMSTPDVLQISSRIPDIARRNAEQLVRREEERREKGATPPIVEALLGLFNATLFQAVEGQRAFVRAIATLDPRYFAAVETFLRESVYQSLKADIDDRRQTLEMHLTPGHIDASQVHRALGVTWPGPAAIREAFELNFGNQDGYQARHRAFFESPVGRLLGADANKHPYDLRTAMVYLERADRRRARQLLSDVAATRARAKAEIAVESATSWTPGEDHRILASLSEEEREAIRGTDAWSDAQQALRAAQWRDEARSAMALLEGNIDTALAWELRDQVEEARGSENTLQIESAVRGFDGTVSAFLSESEHNMGLLGRGGQILLPSAEDEPSPVEVHRHAATVELARIITRERRESLGRWGIEHRPDIDLDTLTAEEAAPIVASWATRPTSHRETNWWQLAGGIVLSAGSLGLVGGDLAIDAINQEVVTRHGDIAKTVEADLLHGGESDAAYRARVEWAHGRVQAADGDYSTGLAMMVDGALQDQQLIQARYALERLERENAPPEELERARERVTRAEERHQERIRIAAEASGWEPGPRSPAEYLVDTYGPVFDEIDDDWGRTYASELITLGRATVQTGTELATEGLGTNDAFLQHVWQGRSKGEIAAAREYWVARHGETLDEFLGINKGRDETDFWDIAAWVVAPLIKGIYELATGPETSGDLAMELEIASIGIPENDHDLAKIAALRYQQQRVRGTGWLARMFLDDCTEARALDGARERLADELRMAAGLGAGEPVFDANGEILPDVAARAFDGRGNLKTGGAAIPLAADELKNAAEAYQKRLADFEAAITLGISIIVAIIVVIITVVLMFFGVGFVLAGIIAGVAGAILGGAALIAAKSGIRGERYGYEEMAVDVAITAVEAVVAVVTGGLMKGLGGPVTGGMARAGLGTVAKAGVGTAGRAAAQSTTKAAVGAAGRAGLSRVSQMMLIQAGGGAITGAAQVAFQDATWDDGLGKGLARVFGGAVKMAAVSAITGGVSEGASLRLNSGFRKLAEAGDNFTMLGRAASKVGQRGAHVISEGVGEMAGGLAGESFAITVEVADGTFTGSLSDVVMRLGAAGLRDAIGGVGRAGTQLYARRRFAGFTAALRDRGDITPAEFDALARRARAAGVELGSYEAMRRHVVEGRRILDSLPPRFRDQVAGLHLDQLRAFAAYLHGADLGGPGARMELLLQMGDVLPGFDAIRVFGEAEAFVARQPAVRERHAEMRARLGAELPEQVRSVLENVPMRTLEALPEGELSALARAVASGHITPATLARLTDVAARHSPGLDVAEFQAAVRRVVEAGQRAMQLDLARQLEQRQTVLADLPEQGQALFARLPVGAMAELHDLLGSGQRGSPQVRESLYLKALELEPSLTRSRFFELLDAGIDTARARREVERSARRAERVALLGHLPEPLRGPLSALPEPALFELRLLQGVGGQLSEPRRQALIERAAAESPGLDRRRLAQALDDAMAHARRAPPRDPGEAAHREALLSDVPSSVRHLVEGTPIVVLRPDELAAYTRAGIESTTLIVDGRPVVVARADADPSALREQGLHALHAVEPSWAPRPGAPDADQLRQWAELPLTEQLALHRNKLEAEVEVQRQRVEGLEAELARSGDDVGVEAQLVDARRTLAALGSRLDEVRGGTPAPRPAHQPGVEHPPQRFVPAGPMATDTDAMAMQRRIDRTTGVDPGPEHVRRQQELADQLRTQASEASQPVTVKGKRVEQFVDAAGNLMVKPDGTPLGYEIDYAYDVRHFSQGLTHVTMKVFLDPAAGVSPADVHKVQRSAQAGIDRFYNGGQHQIQGPDGRPTQLHVEVEWVSSKADAHLVVDLQPGNGQAFQNRWFVDADPTVHAHELSHQLGRLDEYVDHAPHGFAAASRRTATSPGVRTDGGLMGNFWLPDRRSLLTRLVHRLRGIQRQPQVDPRTHVPRRYIDEMAADIQKARGTPTDLQRLIHRTVGIDAHADPGAQQLRQHMLALQEAAKGTTTPVGGWRGALQSVRGAWSSMVGWVRGRRAPKQLSGPIRPPAPARGGDAEASRRAEHLARLTDTPAAEKLLDLAYEKLDPETLDAFVSAVAQRMSQLAPSNRSAIGVTVRAALLLPNPEVAAAVALRLSIAEAKSFRSLASDHGDSPRFTDLLRILVRVQEPGGFSIVKQLVEQDSPTNWLFDLLDSRSGLARIEHGAELLAAALQRHPGAGALVERPEFTDLVAAARRAELAEPGRGADTFQLANRIMDELGTTPARTMAAREVLVALLRLDGDVPESFRAFADIDDPTPRKMRLLAEVVAQLDASSARELIHLLGDPGVNQARLQEMLGGSDAARRLRSMVAPSEADLATRRREGRAILEGLEGTKGGLEGHVRRTLEDIRTPEHTGRDVAFIVRFRRLHPHSLHPDTLVTDLELLWLAKGWEFSEDGSLRRRLEDPEGVLQPREAGALSQAQALAQLLRTIAEDHLHSEATRRAEELIFGKTGTDGAREVVPGRTEDNIPHVRGDHGVFAAVLHERTRSLSNVPEPNQTEQGRFGIPDPATHLPSKHQFDKPYVVEQRKGQPSRPDPEKEVIDRAEADRRAVIRSFNAIVRGIGEYDSVVVRLDAIRDELANATPRLDLTEARIARLLRQFITAGPGVLVGPLARYEQDFQRIAWLIFIREPARDPTALVTAAMFIDAVARGSMTFKQALDSIKIAETGRDVRVRGHGGLFAPTMKAFQKAYRTMLEGLRIGDYGPDILRERTEGLSRDARVDEVHDLLLRRHELVQVWLKARGLVDPSPAELEIAIQELLRRFYYPGAPTAEPSPAD